MKLVLRWLLPAIVIGFHINGFAGGLDSQGRELYRDGEVIVKYKDGVKRTRAQMLELYERVGVVDVKRFGGINKNFEHLLFNTKSRVDEIVADLERDPMVEYAQPNYLIYVLPTAEDNVDAAAAGEKEPCIFPGIPYPPGCEDSGDGGGMPDFPFPGDPSQPGQPGQPGEPGQPGQPGEPCIFPGIPYPPGCEDTGGGENPFPTPTPPSNPADRPAIEPAPAEPAAAPDPDLDKVYGLKKIQAPEAWALQKGSRNMIVAVIDTGIDYNHPDLAFNIWRNTSAKEYLRTGVDKDGTEITGDVVGWDFIHNDNLPYDDHMHGTHCAGTVGAVGNDGRGISGVAQRVSIMGVKFLSAEGQGDTVSAIKSIDYAVSRGAKILSNSWGGKGDDGHNAALEDAIKRAEAKGVLFIAAAGNDSTNNDSDPAFPAAFRTENMIAVAATNERDQMAFFSNYGRESVHVGAPGSGIYSTKPKQGYTSLSGTSMAAPHVSGAAALVWSHFPNADYKEIKRRLLTYGDDIPSLQGKTTTGKRINVYKALTGQ